MLTRKRTAIALGLLGLLVWLPPIFFCVHPYALLCDSSASFFGFTAPYVPLLISLLIISLIAYFFSEEVHSFWFKWMVKRYLPIATGLVFLAYLSEDKAGGSFGPGLDISSAFVLTSLFSLIFIIISLILIVAKSVSLRKGNK